MKRLRDWFNRFWYHPTIDAMQAQMLRRVWAHRLSLRLIRSPEQVVREVDRLALLWRGRHKGIVIGGTCGGNSGRGRSHDGRSSAGGSGDCPDMRGMHYFWPLS